jgi:hypothetical protein
MTQKIDEWQRIENALSCIHVRVAYIWGKPGLGKTYAAYRFGRVENGFYAVTLTQDTGAAELRGHYLFKGRDAVWHHGPFVRAMLEGKRLVINELRHASGDVQDQLFPVLESPETARLTLPNGETIQPAPGYHCVITDNVPPEDHSEALRDRFVCRLLVTRPHPGALEGLDPALRRAAEAGFAIEDDRQISPRDWRSLQNLFPLFGMLEASYMVWGLEKGQMVYDALKLGEKAPKKRG